jgi:hypothetical protein
LGLCEHSVDRGEPTGGPIEDQAALYGVLIKIRDLSLPLLSVTRTELSLTHVMQFLLADMLAGLAGVSKNAPCARRVFA